MLQKRPNNCSLKLLGRIYWHICLPPDLLPMWVLFLEWKTCSQRSAIYPCRLLSCLLPYTPARPGDGEGKDQLSRKYWVCSLHAHFILASLRCLLDRVTMNCLGGGTFCMVDNGHCVKEGWCDQWTLRILMHIHSLYIKYFVKDFVQKLHVWVCIFTWEFQCDCRDFFLGTLNLCDLGLEARLSLCYQQPIPGFLD